MMAGIVVGATALLVSSTGQPPADAVNLPESNAGAALANLPAPMLGVNCPLWCPEDPAEPLTISAPPAAKTKASDKGSVQIARNATRKYHSLARAKKHGYRLLKDKNGVACIAMPGMGGMGVHFANGDLVGTPSVHLRRPEALVYDRENGRRRLVALEYVVLKKDWESVHGDNAPRPRLYGHRFNLTRAGNRFGLPAFYSLHAWIWKHNPDGRFAMWNPNVHCKCC
jgi:hypothetical protein